MEGDLMQSWTPVLMVGSGVIAGVFALLKWFAGRLITDIEGRISEIETRFERLMAELPLHYQRREDAIREFTAINTKLDRLYELLARRHQDD